MDTHKRSLAILSFILLVVSLGYGVFSPILPFYIESMGASGITLGLLNASYAVMRLVFGPIWGSLSDRVGRKRILMIGILGFGITMIWFGIAEKLWMLFAARILGGILSSATAPTTMAYIVDIAPDGEISKGMGRLTAAGGVGGVLGPLLGGVAASVSISTPFFVAAALAGAALILAQIFLPESLHLDREKFENHKKMINLQEWAELIRSPIGKYFLLTFLSSCGLNIFSNTFGLYALERFGYGPEEVGIVYMLLALASMLTVGLLISPIKLLLGERKIVIFGFLGAAASLGLMVTGKKLLTILFFTTMLAVFISLQSTTLISLTSKYTPGEQGITMGFNNSFVSLGRFAGPLLGGALLDWQLFIPFYAASGVLFAAFIFSKRWIDIKEPGGKGRKVHTE